VKVDGLPSFFNVHDGSSRQTNCLRQSFLCHLGGMSCLRKLLSELPIERTFGGCHATVYTVEIARCQARETVSTANMLDSFRS